MFDSFLFNACLRNTVCIAVVLIMVLNAPGYSGSCEIRLFFSAVYGADSFFKIEGVTLFIFHMVIMSFFSMIVIVLKGSNRIRYNELPQSMGETEPGDRLLGKEDSDEDDQ